LLLLLGLKRQYPLLGYNHRNEKANKK